MFDTSATNIHFSRVFFNTHILLQIQHILPQMLYMFPIILIMGNCGTSVRTPFVLTPSGSNQPRMTQGLEVVVSFTVSGTKANQNTHHTAPNHIKRCHTVLHSTSPYTFKPSKTMFQVMCSFAMLCYVRLYSIMPCYLMSDIISCK